MRKAILCFAFVFAAGAAFAGNPKLGLEIETNDTGKPGVIVLGVLPGSPAEHAGIDAGDIIDALDGKPTPDAQRFLAVLSHAGASVKLHVVHPVLPPSTVAIAFNHREQPAAADKSAPRRAAAHMAKRMAPLPHVHWARYRDPNEGAFTIDVPRGWRAQGGAYSVSAVETRTGVTVRSPDGSITLFFGDKNIPAFVVPNQMLAFAGFRQGMRYSPGYNQYFLVEPYETGEQFAANWGAQRVSRECTGVKREQVRALHKASRAMDYAYAQGGIRTSIRAGEASFSCNGGKGAAYVFAATELVESQSGGIWNVKHLAGFISASARAREASQLLAHMAASFMPDPGWLARHNQTAMAVSHIVTETGHAISQSVGEAYWNQSNTQDRAMQGFDEAIRGVNTYRDPESGEEFQLNDTHSHWWIDGDGNKIATDTDKRPCRNCRELQVVPPGH